MLVYAAMWLALVVGQAPGKRWARVTGGALLVFGLPLILTNGFSFFDGPAAVLALLAGLAVALWQPRATTSTADARHGTGGGPGASSRGASPSGRPGRRRSSVVSRSGSPCSSQPSAR